MIRNLRHIFVIVNIVFCVISCTKPPITIVNLKCENLTNPIGIESAQPRLSWQISSDIRDVEQTAYRILVASSEEALTKNEAGIWDSGKITSNQSILVKFEGKDLLSTVNYFWKVKIWDNHRNESDWSEVASWQMGLKAVADWDGAQWIGYEDLPDSMRVVLAPESGYGLGDKATRQPVTPLFRKEFSLNKEIERATLFISGLGQYEARLNGQKVGNGFLTPGWTRYDNTVLYNSFDVNQSLRQGANAIGVIVGSGFYNIHKERYTKFLNAFGMPTMICRLKICYTDSTEENLTSGDDWKTSPSPISFTSIYGGEDYDARLEQAGWDQPVFDDSAWKNSMLPVPPKGKLTAELNYPLAIVDSFAPQKITRITEDKYLYDFGQNSSGVVEIQLKGKAGQTVKLVPGELITKEGEINQSATGSPYYFSYTLKGDGVESWRPRFTYYGFRYVMVEGACPDSVSVTKELPKMVSIQSLHTRNSAPLNGEFHCSSKLFNQIYDLINWGIKSNFQSVLTDCPHREKLGWLEQTFLMGKAINFNFDTYLLYRKIVDDMMDSQLENGFVPNIAPEYVTLDRWLDGYFRDSPEWGSASVILPWLIYEWYGDQFVMEKAWPMMTRYVKYLKSKSKDNILVYGLGDWYDLGPSRPGASQLTPKGFTATALYYYDLQLLSQMAEILGKKATINYYGQWAEEIKIAFNNKYFNKESAVYASGSQTAMAMPLNLGLVDETLTQRVLQNLVDSIVARGKSLTAGDIGFHFLVETLMKTGNSNLLYEMNNRDDVPGYGYQLKKGATALTESWQALENVSNNHLMLGHLMQWFYEGLAGIRQQEGSVAYRNLLIKPTVVGDITNASANFMSPYGKVSSAWTLENTIFQLKLSIPANSTALVYLPVTGNATVSEGGKPVEQVEDIHFVKEESNCIVYKIGSGEYDFRVNSY